MSNQHRPYGNSAFEPEDMSVFFHNLLECTPAAVTVAAGGDSAVPDYRSSGASLNFSDPACFFESEATEGVEKAFSSTVSGDCDAVTSSIKREDFTSAHKATSNRVQSSSSKRSRSSEVHNMSEKRRRSRINDRINEKLKALQSLIPNSNKTDKASMLDEAIEYLKQLQFQVQILTIKNGLSLHPNYAPGSMPSMQLPIGFDAGHVLPYTNRTAETLSGNQQVVMQTVFGSHHLKIPGHQLAVPSQPQKLTTNNNPETSFGVESSLPSHFGIINQLTSAKDPCREEKLPHLQLDVSCSGNNSSSGVSS